MILSPFTYSPLYRAISRGSGPSLLGRGSVKVSVVDQPGTIAVPQTGAPPIDGGPANPSRPSTILMKLPVHATAGRRSSVSKRMLAFLSAPSCTAIPLGTVFLAGNP